MATQATFRRNQELETNRQVMASNFGNTPGEIPQNANDAALAGHIQEIREKSAEYAKLQTEGARQKWEELAAANFQRQQAIKDGIADRVGVEKQNQDTRDMAEAQRLASELNALQQSTPADQNEWTVPLNKLRDFSNTTERIAKLTGADLNAPRQNQRLNPQAFPDGKMYHMENLPDGNLKIKLATGEEFTGDPITVTQKLAEAKVNTAAWAQQKIQEAQQQQPTNQPSSQTTEQAASGSLADDLAARQADALARQFQFADRHEMMQWGENVNQKMVTIQQFEREKQAMEFFTNVPDFPGTPEAIEAVAQIVDNMGLPESAEAMQMAHAFAVQRGLYEPLSQEAMQASNGTAKQSSRPTPPPMIHGGNPEMSQSVSSPYDMPMQDLRKAAIKQELERSGPGYR